MYEDPFYTSARWKRKRVRILRRDGYRCQICKRYGRIKEATIVHHKIPKELRPDLAWDDNNLESVCMSCHNRLHPEKGGSHR